MANSDAPTRRRPGTGSRRSPAQTPAQGPPGFDANLASTRFIQNMVWAVVVCALFVGGQLVRYGLHTAQIRDIEGRTDELYRSVLGPDIGGSPFGRLQFEHGKLAAASRIGLDPLGVLAALSAPADPNLRVEAVNLSGKTGRIQGFFGPNVDGFDAYYEALADNELFLFSLESREDVFGGLQFSLQVEAQ